MVRTRDRIIALIIAIAFFATTFAVSFLVIWELVNEGKDKKVDSSQNDQPQQFLQGTKLEGFTPVSKVDNLQKIDLKAGSGKTVKEGDSVVVHYTGAVAGTGIIFQSSFDSGQPVPLNVKSGPNGVIAGWVQGIPGMKEGGQRRLVIPAGLAYGASPPQDSGIPPNAALVFDVTVVSVGAQ